jgi:hypothetical protein
MDSSCQLGIIQFVDATGIMMQKQSRCKLADCIRVCLFDITQHHVRRMAMERWLFSDYVLQRTAEYATI